MLVLTAVCANLISPSFNVLTSVRELRGPRNRHGEEREKSETFHEELHDGKEESR